MAYFIKLQFANYITFWAYADNLKENLSLSLHIISVNNAEINVKKKKSSQI